MQREGAFLSMQPLYRPLETPQPSMTPIGSLSPDRAPMEPPQGGFSLKAHHSPQLLHLDLFLIQILPSCLF